MVGLLWFDDSGRDLVEKVKPAVRRYVEKFGRPPAVCYVHPSALDSPVTVLDVDGVVLRVEAREWVLRHHLLVGVEDDGTSAV